MVKKKTTQLILTFAKDSGLSVKKIKYSQPHRLMGMCVGLMPFICMWQCAPSSHMYEKPRDVAPKSWNHLVKSERQTSERVANHCKDNWIKWYFYIIYSFPLGHCVSFGFSLLSCWFFGQKRILCWMKLSTTSFASRKNTHCNGITIRKQHEYLFREQTLSLTDQVI